jgi:hypothetical protein
MIQVLGTIDSIDVPIPQPGVPPQPDEATVVATLVWPSTGTMTVKLYPAATAGLATGLCRVQVDQG